MGNIDYSWVDPKGKHNSNKKQERKNKGDNPLRTTIILLSFIIITMVAVSITAKRVNSEPNSSVEPDTTSSMHIMEFFHGCWMGNSSLQECVDMLDLGRVKYDVRRGSISDTIELYNVSYNDIEWGFKPTNDNVLNLLSSQPLLDGFARMYFSNDNFVRMEYMKYIPLNSSEAGDMLRDYINGLISTFKIVYNNAEIKNNSSDSTINMYFRYFNGEMTRKALVFAAEGKAIIGENYYLGEHE